MRIIKSFTAVIAALIIITGTLAFGVMGVESVTGSEVAAFAVGYDGCGYQYASRGPKKFDCSGFVCYVLGNFGITFGNSTSDYNTTDEASSFGTVIADMAEAKEGDIVVWKSHAAVYLGNGECIAAMNPNMGVCVREVEDFVDKNGNKNPSHFFIRPFEYAEETTEVETSETAPQRMTFKERIENTNDRIVEFFKELFRPLTMLFK